MRALRTAALATALALGAPAAHSHPHVFIDTGIEFLFDAAGRVSALRIVWVYDDFTSMVILADRGFDPDGDGALTEAETARLSGFDMQWDADFAGDTYALADDAALALSRPRDWTARVAQGRIVTTHVRDLGAPADPAAVPLVVQVYDPGYYSAYTIAAQPVLTGRADCRAQVYGPDLEAAQATLEAALAEFSGEDLEEGFPAVGAAYAEEVRLTCDAPS